MWLKGGFNLYIFKNLFRTTLSSSWPRPLPHPLFFQVNFKKVKVSLQLPQMLRSENQQDHQVPNFPQVRLNPPKALKSPLQVKIIRNDIDAFCRQNWWIIVLSFTYFEKAKKCDIYFCLMDRKVFVTTAAGTGKSLSEALIFASTDPQYDNRLIIVQDNCKLKIPAEHVKYTNCCFCLVLTFRTILAYNMFCRCCKLLKKIYLYCLLFSRTQFVAFSKKN